jgi:predicted unusual protein kinase regulating ubiquinone biosynthesis (AarF/ABC1/UbiB family)
LKKKQPPASALARSFMLARVGANILRAEVAGYAKEKISSKIEDIKNKTRIEQIRLLTETLSQLKGSAMKFGQLLSLEAQDFLPPEAISLLATLQKNASPVDHTILFDLAKRELGEDKFNKLSLTTEPIGVASIGQVFRGNLEGRPVAVKIQYPGVKESVSSDTQILKKIVGAGLLITGKHLNLDEVFIEIETVLKLESDYLREKNNLKRYADVLKSDSRFIVPAVFEDYCTERVLTMSFEDGLDLKSWILEKPPMQNRINIGTALLDLYNIEFFKNGLVQTDPNLANYLVRQDTLQIVLLDFGAVIEYSKDFVKYYTELAKILLNGSNREIIDFCVKFDLLDSRESDEAKDAFVEMVRLSVKPFLPKLQPFTFDDKDYATQIKNSIFNFTKKSKFSKPPREFIFLHRKLGGIFNIMKMMNLSIDLSPYWVGN